ncbi:MULTISPECIES: NAD(P)-dependent oxidoreductase [unclassified Nocardioides]|uniref:NAD(P)-dependent oxidoreductase n=1 Tax=unclassified Nocardioides TaxID=2615069 RepID=UPI001885F457|nr:MULTISPECIES: NAD(P)-dependent oxidoreductase [unclassified Nocardioides]
MTSTAPATTLKVGWIGLGSQGGPMARVLAGSGVPVQLWARRPESLTAYDNTPATTSSTSLGLLMENDVVVLVVRDDDDVKDVLFGAWQPQVMGGFGAKPPIASMKPGSVVVIHSTVHPDTIREIAAVAHEHGVGVVDAPVSGGGHAAEDKSLLVMTAGDPDDVAKVKPIFEQYSNLIPYLGPVGAAQSAKIINNVLLTANMGVAESAFAIAKQVGVDPESLKLVLSNGSGRSFGVTMVGGDDWDLKPAATVAGPLLQKDTRLLVALAEAEGIDTGAALSAAQSALARMGLDL